MLNKVKSMFNEFSETYKILSQRKNGNKFVCESEERVIDGDSFKTQYCSKFKISVQPKSVDAICLNEKKELNLIEFKYKESKTIKKDNISAIYDDLKEKFQGSEELFKEYITIKKWTEIKSIKYFFILKVNNKPARKTSTKHQIQSFKMAFDEYTSGNNVKNKFKICLFTGEFFDKNINAFKMHPEIID